MKAIDTNLIIRLLLDDDPEQSAAVKRLLTDTDVVIIPTVLVETLWVLASCYGASREQLVSSIELLAKHPRITIGEDTQGAEFLRLWRGGLDAEDAAHLAFAGDAAAFVTFDRDLVKRAKKLGSTIPAELAG